MVEGTAETTKHAAIFLQDACYQHQYIRSRDLSTIVERPERLRAVTVGLSAAIARLEALADGKPKPSTPPPATTVKKSESVALDDLAGVMGRMNITHDPQHEDRPLPVSIVRSHASVDFLNNPAVKYVHGDIEGDVYLEKLKSWVTDSWNKIHDGGSEIPEGLPQGDLYLCPETIQALEGAIGTICEAVDKVITSSRAAPPKANDPEYIHRAFVAIRPPGHHCGEDTPSGFCFVNNVAIGAAHAHLKHGVNRVVILDIDLHHGNGTQSIAWQINEETYRQQLELEAGALRPPKPGLQVYYGSVHDILSFPCEDGIPALVQAASVSLHQSHGQHIENVHLQTYTSEKHFWEVLYKNEYSRILRKAEDFLDNTGGPGDDVIVFISCGMDACEHEYDSMSRHNRKVPTSFYYQFARDVRALSDRYARGRVVSVLEGGYSDRALISGAMAHISGLIDETQLGGKVDEQWWDVKNLEKLEKATKKRRGGRISLGITGAHEPWLERTIDIFQSLEPSAKVPSHSSRTLVPPSSRTLRDRKSKSASATATLTPILQPKALGKAELTSKSMNTGVEVGSSSSSDGDQGSASAPRKLPRVILRLGPDPSLSN